MLGKCVLRTYPPCGHLPLTKGREWRSDGSFKLKSQYTDSHLKILRTNCAFNNMSTFKIAI